MRYLDVAVRESVENIVETLHGLNDPPPGLFCVARGATLQEESFLAVGQVEGDIMQSDLGKSILAGRIMPGFYEAEMNPRYPAASFTSAAWHWEPSEETRAKVRKWMDEHPGEELTSELIEGMAEPGARVAERKEVVNVVTVGMTDKGPMSLINTAFIMRHPDVEGQPVSLSEWDEIGGEPGGEAAIAGRFPEAMWKSVEQAMRASGESKWKEG